MALRKTCPRARARSARPLARAVSTYCLRISSRKEFLVSIVSVAKLPTTMRRDRQRDVPEVVDDARRPGQLVPVVGGQAAQREPLQKLPPPKSTISSDARSTKPGIA